MNNQINQFQRELNLSSYTQKYLEERSFNDYLINKFYLGFCPATSSFSFDLLNGRLIVPIFDVYNNHIAFAGRRIDNYSTNVKEYYQSKTNNLDGLQKFLKWKTSKWINMPYKKSNHLYNLNNAKESIFNQKFCFIVEGYFDVMHLVKLGYENVVALCGVSLTDRQCDLIFRYCNKIVLMLDGDEAGQTSLNKSMLKAQSKNLFTHIVSLPQDKDPDDLNKEVLEFIVQQIINSQEEMYINI